MNDLETFLHKEEEQASVRAERSAKVMEGQERLEVAKTSTLEEIAPHVNDQQNLDFIRDFLSTHWKNLLVVTCARQGKDSEPWKQAVTTMDELIWSVKPKFTREDRQQLVAMQSKLLNNLREGMERLGMPSTERDDFIAKLVHAHGRTAVNHKDATETVETPADSNTDKNRAVSDAVENPEVSVEAGAKKKAEQADTGTLVEIDDAHTERARQLATGDWMEFQSSDGKAKRATLSWISPITNTYLFTDRQGLKAGNFSLQELAHLLRCARANVLDAAPLMDRAVCTVFKEYQKH